MNIIYYSVEYQAINNGVKDWMFINVYGGWYDYRHYSYVLLFSIPHDCNSNGFKNTCMAFW